MVADRTHDWNKFIKPQELEELLLSKILKTTDIKGLEYNPITKKWKNQITSK